MTTRERIFAVGLRVPKESRAEVRTAFEELQCLIDTAGGTIVGEMLCEVRRVHSATIMGRGQVEMIGEAARRVAAETVVVDGDLTPAQNRNLNDSWGVKVLDRTAVILDIFARRAQTSEGKLQVELAQLRYRLPRLVGKGLSLSQQAGYIGNRGPGETKLEIDRRRIRERVTGLQRALQAVRARREAVRQRRRAVPVVALIGYTNAGKSTLMNALSHADVFVEDKLFATLDPVTRRVRLPSGRTILLTDTVGFIRRLPHQLVESFKATFEEVADADYLVHVVDISTPEAAAQQAVVTTVLAEMGLHAKPCLTVYNKSELCAEPAHIPPGGLLISALAGRGLTRLMDAIEGFFAGRDHEIRFRLPHAAGHVLAELYRHATIHSVRHHARAVIVDAAVSEAVYQKYRHYVQRMK